MTNNHNERRENKHKVPSHMTKNWKIELVDCWAIVVNQVEMTAHQRGKGLIKTKANKKNKNQLSNQSNKKLFHFLDFTLMQLPTDIFQFQKTVWNNPS